jgi:hypothetical protein
VSAPHSPGELQRLSEKRFAGKSAYRDKVWRVLVDEYFARWFSRILVVDDEPQIRRIMLSPAGH